MSNKKNTVKSESDSVVDSTSSPMDTSMSPPPEEKLEPAVKDESNSTEPTSTTSIESSASRSLEAALEAAKAVAAARTAAAANPTAAATTASATSVTAATATPATEAAAANIPAFGFPMMNLNDPNVAAMFASFSGMDPQLLAANPALAHMMFQQMQAMFLQQQQYAAAAVAANAISSPSRGNSHMPSLTSSPANSLQSSPGGTTITTLSLNENGSAPTTPRKRTANASPQNSPNSELGRGRWSVDEDNRLKSAVQQFEAKNWKSIAQLAFGGEKTDVQCLHRWQKVLKPGLVKGPWTAEEDARVVELVGQFGLKKWSQIASLLKGRLGKQCRERWYNHLDPNIRKDTWTTEEDELILRYHAQFGNKWAQISKLLPGRTDNAIKNRWNSTLYRMIKMKQGEFGMNYTGLPPAVPTDDVKPEDGNEDEVDDEGEPEEEEVDEEEEEEEQPTPKSKSKRKPAPKSASRSRSNKTTAVTTEEEAALLVSFSTPQRTQKSGRGKSTPPQTAPTSGGRSTRASANSGRSFSPPPARLTPPPPSTTLFPSTVAPLLAAATASAMETGSSPTSSPPPPTGGVKHVGLDGASIIASTASLLRLHHTHSSSISSLAGIPSSPSTSASISAFSNSNSTSTFSMDQPMDTSSNASSLLTRKPPALLIPTHPGTAASNSFPFASTTPGSKKRTRSVSQPEELQSGAGSSDSAAAIYASGTESVTVSPNSRFPMSTSAASPLTLLSASMSSYSLTSPRTLFPMNTQGESKENSDENHLPGPSPSKRRQMSIDDTAESKLFSSSTLSGSPTASRPTPRSSNTTAANLLSHPPHGSPTRSPHPPVRSQLDIDVMLNAAAIISNKTAAEAAAGGQTPSPTPMAV